MPFIVITGNDRKQFEKLREAISYSTVQSRIFQMDAFGNLNPLSNEEIQELLRYEPISRQESPQNNINQVEQNQPLNQTEQKKQDKNIVHYDKIEKKEDVKVPEKKKEKEPFNFKIILYIIYFILIALIIYVAYRIIAPYWKEFIGISGDYGLV
jgi:hypothetical protein